MLPGHDFGMPDPGVPLNALYKVVFYARRKIRRALRGYYIG